MAWTRLVSSTRLWCRPSRGRTTVRPRPAVLFVHGNSQDERVAITPAFFGQRRLITRMADAGYVVMCDQHHDPFSWSNDDSIEAMDAAYLASQRRPGVLRGPVHLFGVSMGFQQICVWARRNPDRVASVAGILPLCNVAWTFANTFLTAMINAAHFDQVGFRYRPEVDGLERDPMMFTADLVQFAGRMNLWHSSGDSIVPPWTVEDFADAVGCARIEVDGGEHSEEAVAAAPWPDILAHLRAFDFVAEEPEPEPEPEPPAPDPIAGGVSNRFVRLLTQPVTIVNRAALGTDAYGNDEIVEVDRYETLGYVEQTATTEVVVDRDTVNTDAVLVLATHRLVDGNSTENLIDHGDAVIVGEDVYEVVGRPARPWSPRLRSEHHIEARLRSTSDVPVDIEVS